MGEGLGLWEAKGGEGESGGDGGGGGGGVNAKLRSPRMCLILGCR